jgi:hypothetical protein
MIAEQIRRPYILSSHWRHIQKAVSGLPMPGAQYKSRPYLLHIKQHFTSHPSVPESITTHVKKGIHITAASAAKPGLSDRKNIPCENLLFYVLKIFLHTGHLITSSGAKTLTSIMHNSRALLLQTV